MLSPSFHVTLSKEEPSDPILFFSVEFSLLFKEAHLFELSVASNHSDPLSKDTSFIERYDRANNKVHDLELKIKELENIVVDKNSIIEDKGLIIELLRAKK